MNAKLTKGLDNLALAVGFILMFGIMISEELRHLLGVGMGYILGWMPGLFPFGVVLFIMAAITGLYASLIQKYTMDWDFMRSQQEKMTRVQRELKEAQLSGDQARQQKLQQEQMKMVSEQGKMMQMQFKPMLYIGIISIPLFMWAYLYIAEHALTMNFPFWGTQQVTAVVLGPIVYWYYWYFICSIPVSQIIRKALDIGSMG
ncbi:MAG TPA: EMC3/TMCO1 family protein [Methanotrichaceae archaeon]|nr:EMC3/TMCO1 family protein [Methanotrichaceae archaeon]